MYSLNVPVPGVVKRLAADLHPKLTGFDRVRDRHTLVCKRLEGEVDPHRVREQLRPVLADASTFEARIDRIDYFGRPPHGSAPVVYLAVESPGLRALHDRLVDVFGAVEGLEGGDDYAPHVTLARGGSLETARELATEPIDPVTWTVSRLDLRSREYREAVASLPLSA